ncbi:hypothetical protein KM043_018208 [Ampulex compressa]|nr:hypothetical protein KM043_018208 [Ampulex compressa]
MFFARTYLAAGYRAYVSPTILALAPYFRPSLARNNVSRQNETLQPPEGCGGLLSRAVAHRREGIRFLAKHTLLTNIASFLRRIPGRASLRRIDLRFYGPGFERRLDFILAQFANKTVPTLERPGPVYRDAVYRDRVCVSTFDLRMDAGRASIRRTDLQLCGSRLKVEEAFDFMRIYSANEEESISLLEHRGRVGASAESLVLQLFLHSGLIFGCISKEHRSEKLIYSSVFEDGTMAKFILVCSADKDFIPLFL